MFKRSNFCHVASNNRNNVKSGVFIYRTTDNLATVSANGYFNDMIIDINLHDLIIHEQIDASDSTKVERNLLAVSAKSLDNINTVVVQSKWEKDIGQQLDGFVKIDGSSVMTGPLRTSALNNGQNINIPATSGTMARVEDIENKITNCITEIPQDINLELSNGTLTLKAGSKVYVPNGSGNFDVITIANDLTTISAEDGARFVVINPAGTSLSSNLISSTSSGTTPPSGSGLFYNTSTNSVNYYNSGVIGGRRSFPIAVITVSNGAISSIDQVFNGLGYIGSTIFALPGVKGLIPSGRNSDGTLNNGHLNITSVLTYTNTSAFDRRNIIIRNNEILLTSVYLDVEGNRNRRTDNNNIVAYADAGIISATTGGVITSFEPKTAFHAVDYNNFANTDFAINNTQTLRTLYERFNDIINVKDFGAVGDGVTDDTAAIQAAINSTHHANTGIRDIVFFPSGKYKVSTITISNGQSIILSNPTLISDSIAIEIDNAYAGTIIEYANITAKDCGIWIKRGKAVHLEHIRVDITHETANSDTDEVSGIRIGGVSGLYAGNENVISDCSIYSTHFIKNYGFWNQADDNQINNLIVYNFKWAIRDQGGSNTYDQIHGWTNGYTEGTEAERITSLTESALFYCYRDITIQSAYADSFQYAIFCTDSNGDYQHKIDGMLVYHSDQWPASLPIYFWRIAGGNAYHENSVNVSNLDMNNGSSAPQYFASNTNALYLSNFYTNNPYNANITNCPIFTNVLMQDVGSGLGYEARLTAVLSDRKTPTGWLGFGSWTSGAYFCKWNLNAHDTYQDSYIIMQQNTGYGVMQVPELRPHADDAINIGAAVLRWKEIFCANGTINTSDEREKTNIENIDEKVFNAWAKVEFKQFMFKEAVSKKGENARIHFGVIAQQVKEAFESEGLDGFKYGLLCYDEWQDEYKEVVVIDEEAEFDENGNETKPAKTHIENQLVVKAGNRYGIRYTEALALECAYQRWLSEKLEKRLNKLENDEK